jgi:hypothetical protein
MEGRQGAVNDLYRLYRDAGDDHVNAKHCIQTEFHPFVSDEEIDLAQAAYADPEDAEDEFEN